MFLIVNKLEPRKNAFTVFDLQTEYECTTDLFIVLSAVEILHALPLFFLAVPIAQRRLMDVKLGELPNWAATRDFTPNGILSAVRRGHDRFYNKYINVKRGGIGGVAMLLTGYVVLSYIWEYDHIKHDRWRKYH
ncbi:ATP synthase subunit f, mitochondrial-like [Acipenser oxyrinchus oxyrinchus]|uniref:ATP synthase subunit f, mitochondrial-like n=1 Tax=Acipenser oxyrinchus oxyrinchus TaxID=40147 RepID=A0AAD8D604_ACIOX|nr:ATP synthase subunit f, mitochondrial-like [Acipenser oxyrinchus oxyrinchus]